MSGSTVAASSSSVRLQLTTPVELPASDMKIAFCPLGETSSMSMSSGYACASPLMLTFTSPTVPVTPETTQVDGYGVACEASLIVIEPPVH